jgi:hypothetical protein
MDAAPFYLVILHDANKGADWVMEHSLYLTPEDCAKEVANGEASIDWENENIVRVLRVDPAAGKVEDATAEIADLAGQYTIDKRFEPDAITERFFHRMKVDFYVEPSDDQPGPFKVRGFRNNPHWVP